MNPWTLSVEGLSRHEYWRLWTAHLYHYSWLDLCLNMGLLLPPLLLVPRRIVRMLPFWIFILMPILSAALLRIPSLEYLGSTAWVCAVWGLAGAILMRLKRQEDRVWGMILISLLVIKISSEAHGIRLPQPGAELRTVPLGHQLGAFMGLVSGLVWPWKYIFKQPLVASKN